MMWLNYYHIIFISALLSFSLTELYCMHVYRSIINFAIFSDAKNFAVIYLKFKQRAKLQKDANGIANSDYPDQTAPLGAV